MCGRFRLSRPEKLAERFDVEADDAWAPRFNIAPTQNVVVIRQELGSPGRRASQMRWGLIPSYAKDAGIGGKLINARAETVAQKPAFREAFRKRRCLIPADGFYEWKTVGKSKTPFCFTMADDSLFAFAGIWEQWKNPAGQCVESCSILTTTPNALCAELHDRMPVILLDDAYDLWLDPRLQNTDTICNLLKPPDARLMKRYPVSNRVNRVEYDDPACAQAVS
jgi:putative SOS response-associated peptidase YedK